MTMAVCIKCGCEKMGAYTPCPDCDFVPESEQEQSAALGLSDWCKGWDELDRVSDQLMAAATHIQHNKRSTSPPPDAVGFDDDELP